MKRPIKRSSEGVDPETTGPVILAAVVSHEAIACRAHERFVQRGGTHGQDLEDWLTAERDLREELAGRTRL